MDVDVKAWMSGDPVSIDAEASALEAFERMAERGIRHLPVLDGEGRLVGVLSIDDLRAAMPFALQGVRPLTPSERTAAREWRVADLMSDAPVTAHADEALAPAVERMVQRRLGCLPVVDDAGAVVGLLSESDALNALLAALQAERSPGEG